MLFLIESVAWVGVFEFSFLLWQAVSFFNDFFSDLDQLLPKTSSDHFETSLTRKGYSSHHFNCEEFVDLDVVGGGSVVHDSWWQSRVANPSQDVAESVLSAFENQTKSNRVGNGTTEFLGCWHHRRK